MRESILKSAREAQRICGRSPVAQIWEAMALRMGGTGLGTSEYFFYGLFAPNMKAEERRRFVGWRKQRQIDQTLNAAVWRAVANDKLLFYSTATGFDLPFPRIRAVYSPLGRYLSGVSKLRSTQELVDFCRDPTSFPVFAKPMVGSYGRGAFSMLRYEPGSDSLLLGSGELYTVSEAVAEFTESKRAGYVFQDLVEPHPDTVAICGDKVTSVRVIVLAGPEGPGIFRCVWKIPTGRNMSDNFMHGETGNLLAYVDPESGRVGRVISGVGTGLKEIERHPETGATISGALLPDWTLVRDTCLTAGRCYPGLRFQHWDVALSRSGPQLLEVNVEGSLDLHQLAGGRGVLDEDLVRALARASR